MRFKPLLLMALFASACSMLPIPGMSGGGTKSETHASSQTEEVRVNGRPVRTADADDDAEAPRAKKRGDGDIGKTCHKNDECAAEACFVGAGDLGYCTRMCNSWSDCPSHWECKRARNAPQKICMQDD